MKAAGLILQTLHLQNSHWSLWKWRLQDWDLSSYPFITFCRKKKVFILKYGIVCRCFHFTLSCVVPILSYLINIHISFKFTSLSSLLPATVNATTPTPPTVTTNMPDTNRNDKPNNGKKSCVTFFLVLCLEQNYCILRCVFHSIIMSRVMPQFWSHLHWNKSEVTSLNHVRMV